MEQKKKTPPGTVLKPATKVVLETSVDPSSINGLIVTPAPTTTEIVIEPLTKESITIPTKNGLDSAELVMSLDGILNDGPAVYEDEEEHDEYVQEDEEVVEEKIIENPENLPVVKAVFDMPEDIVLHKTNQDTPLATHVDNSAQASHVALSHIYQAWGLAKNIDDVCKLAAITMNVLEKQRKLMLQPYGTSDNAQKGRGISSID